MQKCRLVLKIHFCYWWFRCCGHSSSQVCRAAEASLRDILIRSIGYAHCDLKMQSVHSATLFSG